MRKIFFIELLHHHECLENPYLKFKEKGFETKAILGEYVYKKSKGLLKYKKEFFILKQPQRTLFSSFSFFGKIKYVFNQFFEINKNISELKKIIKKEMPNILYINTIESPFLIPLMIYLLLLKDKKIYLTIHNLNRLKVHFTKYFLFDFLIKKLIKKADKIILLGEYLKFNDKNIQDKVIYINNRLPINKKIKKFDKLTFVTSGNLDYTTKDIESIIKGFGKFLERNSDYKDKIQLALLGQINEEVKKWIKKYNIEDIVVTFNSYVGEKDMEKYMGGAHYAIISTYKKSIYGKYKISGAFGDAIAFNLPILLSNNYASDYKADNIIRFDNDELYILLEKIILGRKKK